MKQSIKQKVEEGNKGTLALYAEFPKEFRITAKTENESNPLQSLILSDTSRL